jgi:hypothetical protein
MTELTMVVPNLTALAELARRDPVRWAAANRVLVRASPLVGTGRAGDGAASALGLDAGLGGLARFSYLHDTGAWPQGGCIRLDPVELGVGPRGLFLDAACLPDLQRREADELVQELEPMMTEFGWHLEAPIPSRWYVLTAESLGAGLGPPEMAQGESLMQRLAGNAAGREWARLLNEIQVILHQHPVNLSRETQGRARANCLWPWGGGEAVSLPGARTPELFSDGDPVLGGIAKALGKPLTPADSLSQVRLPWSGSVLICLDGTGPLEQRLDELESRWLAPLMARAIPPRRFTLCDLDGSGYRLGVLQWWNRWRKSPGQGGTA